MRIKWLTILFAVFILISVIELIRREKITFKYAVSWLGMSSLAILFAVFDSVLFRIAKGCGFVLPSNFIFFILGMLFVLSSLLFTVFLCQQNNHSETLAQKVAILEKELRELRERSSPGIKG
jgi:hypothetical protein